MANWFRCRPVPLEELPIMAEQLDTYRKGLRFTLPINVMLAASVVLILYPCRDPIELFSWFGVLGTICAFRWPRAAPDSRDSMVRHQRSIIIGSIASGAAWAVVPGFMFTLADPDAAVLLMVITGLTAGATVQAMSFALAGVAFTTPVLMLTALRLGFIGPTPNLILGVNICLYMMFLLRSSLRGEAGFKTTVALKLEATALAASLEREHAATEAGVLRLSILAATDPLTGLANRTSFAAALASWLQSAEKDRQSSFLFMLDLDHFKSVNDTLGHGVGDIVLKEVAARLRGAVDGAFVARLGGDEFAVLLALPCAEDCGVEIADVILGALGRPVAIGGRFVNIGASLGMARFPEDGLTADDLLARADLALYAAKDGGRQQWRRFDTASLERATLCSDVEHDLPGAISTGLEVWFQPQVSLRDPEVTGVEALLRWRHPIHGWIPPPVIVAAAQRIHCSEALTGHVLDKACSFAKRLERAGFPGMVVAVNLSPNELTAYDVTGVVDTALRRHDLAAHRLELEITEEALAVGEEALAVVRRLSGLGASLAIDDFGTGYSSIASLRNLHVDRIKIDRGLISGCPKRNEDRVLVKAILGIGRSLDIDVIAEGVEESDEARLLGQLGCRTAQGYFFSRPLSADDLLDWLQKRERFSLQREMIAMT